jgi:hypothetical protein
MAGCRQWTIIIIMKKILACSSAALLALAFLTGSAIPAWGQGNTWVGTNLAQMVEAAKWRFGVLRLNAALEVVNAGYDTDIYYGYFEPVPDWTFSAGLPLQIILPLSKKVVLDVSERPEYLFYLHTERERAWNNVFSGRLHFALDRVYAQAEGGMSDVRTRFSPELYINVREKRDDLNGLLFWQASQATSFALIYGWSRFDYSDQEFNGTSLAETLARQEQNLDLVAYVQPSSRTRLSLDAQYGTYVFANQMSNLRDSRSYGIFGGVEFIPRAGEVVRGAGIRGSLKLGYQRLDLIDPSLKDGEGFTGEGDIIFDLSRKTSAHVFYFRGFDFSVFSSSTYYLSGNFGAGLSQRLSRATTLSYDASFGRTAYPGEEDSPDIWEHFMTHRLSLDLRLARQLNMSFRAEYNRRLRAATGISSDRAFFGINLTYGYPGSRMTLPIGGLSR